MARQEAIVKRVWGILLFFTQIGFIVFTHLVISQWLRELLPQLYSLRLCPFASLRETKILMTTDN
jgi:hypothetical protein